MNPSARPDRPGGYARLDDRVVVVTGATGGIGAATAEQLVAGGARVALGHVPGDEVAAKELAARLGTDRAHPIAVDVVDEGSVADLVAGTVALCGGVDGLVTSAGVMEQVPFAELGPDVWHRTIGVNLTGTYLCIRAALPHLRRGGRNGRPAAVVTVASQMAYTGGTDAAAYCASKAGTLGLTRALAHELAPDVRVNAVAPGPVDTPMTRPHATPEWVERKTAKLAMRRFGTAGEVASVIRFLISDEASFLTGQTVSPNGGGAMP
ncbi:SDR family NAD(P)-dependent oxidoreductase [Pseudonocardia sp.]|uniref:SDR family NAD(P)-dependent oxidoreductase n=1 Tax=Pseudonocardia sp. TaxID=60912 RepID=UPI003D0BFD92